MRHQDAHQDAHHQPRTRMVDLLTITVTTPQHHVTLLGEPALVNRLITAYGDYVAGASLDWVRIQVKEPKTRTR